MLKMLKDFNYSGSAPDTSLLLWGGEIKTETKEPILDENGSPKVFKSGDRIGEIRLVKCVKYAIIKGILKDLGIKPKSEWKMKKEGLFMTNEKTLLEVLKELKILDEELDNKIKDNEVPWNE